MAAWTPGSEMRPYTETSALEDILEWSRDRPGWLRDALRRLMVGGELSDRNIDELEEICLGNGGDGFPLSDGHIAPQRLAGKPVAITGLCDPLGVNARIDALAAQTPVAIRTPLLSRDTAAGNLLRGLSAKSSPAELDLLITLSGKEKTRLSSLDGDLAQNPAKAAEKLRACGARLESAFHALNRLVDAAGTNNFAELRGLEADAEVTAEAAQLASDSLFREVPLPGIGSDAWRRLWEGARTYSDTR